MKNIDIEQKNEKNKNINPKSRTFKLFYLL